MTLPDASGTAAATPGARRSAIYDLGYQGYDGPRLGRRAAIVTLFWSSWRSAFGLGRSGKSKIVPWGLTVLALVPAAVAVGIVALVGDAVQPFTYDNYLPQMAVTLAIFTAAQAPELVGSDQRNHVLSLYFSHAIQRIDYATAKMAALSAALLVLTLTPLLVLFAGKVLSATDVIAALGDEAPHLVQIVVSSLLYSVTFAVIGLAIAAFTPRRSFATGGIIAFFLVTSIVSQILSSMDAGELSRYAQLIDVNQILNGATYTIFGGPGFSIGPRNPSSAPPDLSGLAYIGALAVVLVIGIGVTLLRYRRVQA
jgi:ABC-2 type transport system permease protein